MAEDMKPPMFNETQLSALLAPVWLQLAHLLVADLFWIALVLTAAAALSDEAAQESRADEGQRLRPLAEQT